MAVCHLDKNLQVETKRRKVKVGAK
ncbi:hypothetical protein C5167_034077 [Papaver somniferum]|uniref:Uncharacterized protein n=1 Tax=Papaver somniferum TaxID=3469 RepID=A0A4Y7KC14_PAPSO|nr:hypothetical protein C5167_034077 [Papaver somniferum]